MTLLSWHRSIEQIVVANKDCRILGVTSVRVGSGVSLICRRMAKAMAASGAKTLIVNLSLPAESAAGAVHGRIPSVVPSIHGYDVVSGYDPDGNPTFSNALRLSEMLDTDFSTYARIILDLPPVSGETNEAYSPVTLAPVCDRLNVVCVVGTDTRTELHDAVALLQGAGGSVSAIIANEYKKVDTWTTLRAMIPMRAAG